jgi:hypothetical protein
MKVIVKFLVLIGVMYFCICLGYFGLYTLKQYESAPTRPFVRQVQTILTQPISDLFGEGVVSLKSDWDSYDSSLLKNTEKQKITEFAYSSEFINKSVIVSSTAQNSWALIVCQTLADKSQECRQSLLYSTGDKAFQLKNSQSLEGTVEFSFFAIKKDSTLSTTSLVSTVDSNKLGSQLHVKWF